MYNLWGGGKALKKHAVKRLADWLAAESESDECSHDFADKMRRRLSLYDGVDLYHEQCRVQHDEKTHSGDDAVAYESGQRKAECKSHSGDGERAEYEPVRSVDK